AVLPIEWHADELIVHALEPALPVTAVRRGTASTGIAPVMAAVRLADVVGAVGAVVAVLGMDAPGGRVAGVVGAGEPVVAGLRSSVTEAGRLAPVVHRAGAPVVAGGARGSVRAESRRQVASVRRAGIAVVAGVPMDASRDRIAGVLAARDAVVAVAGGPGAARGARGIGPAGCPLGAGVAVIARLPGARRHRDAVPIGVAEVGEGAGIAVVAGSSNVHPVPDADSAAADVVEGAGVVIVAGRLVAHDDVEASRRRSGGVAVVHGAGIAVIAVQRIVQADAGRFEAPVHG